MADFLNLKRGHGEKKVEKHWSSPCCCQGLAKPHSSLGDWERGFGENTNQASKAISVVLLFRSLSRTRRGGGVGPVEIDVEVFEPWN